MSTRDYKTVFCATGANTEIVVTLRRNTETSETVEETCRRLGIRYIRVAFKPECRLTNCLPNQRHVTKL